jgi:hypothetical protein
MSTISTFEQIGRDCFPGLRVSTVWLQPGEYETIIFHRLPNGLCAEELYCERYATREAVRPRRPRTMTELEAIRIVYNLAVKLLRLPVEDNELDALFKVREMVK